MQTIRFCFKALGEVGAFVYRSLHSSPHMFSQLENRRFWSHRVPKAIRSYDTYCKVYSIYIANSKTAISRICSTRQNL